MGGLQSLLRCSGSFFVGLCGTWGLFEEFCYFVHCELGGCPTFGGGVSEGDGGDELPWFSEVLLQSLFGVVDVGDLEAAQAEIVGPEDHVLDGGCDAVLL